MEDKRTRWMEQGFRLASTAILGLSLIAAAVWMIAPERLNLEPTLVLLGLLYAAVPLFGRWLIRRLNEDLARERMTMPYALAYGYLTNYLVPVVRRLRKEHPDPAQLAFYVYIPRSLDELRPASIDDLLTELEHRNYRVETVELSFPDERRTKDFRTARRSPGDALDVKYFDFPTTLLTLDQAVEYKLDTREDSFPARQREALGQRYIEDFRRELEKMLSLPRYELIHNNIRIVDGGLNFLEDRPQDEWRP